ncbi:unnamed protein product [Ambrosiozyma monospora]|uniref:Unnamed protein product n=1 Tax=Ambrosiozyma monospora TaxID=43982 RepID=A0ACB5TBZ1_AMBMO|nr:unnamed protein product [Ambrosiozyma monospora]
MPDNTLKALTKSLQQEFSSSKTDNDHGKISETLLEDINLFLQQHNTYESLESNQLSDEVYKIYKTFVSKDSNKEPLFIKILTLLIFSISDDNDFALWTHKYLKHAIDAAGLPIQYAELCTKLVEKTLFDVPTTDDEKLQDMYNRHSLSVFQLLMVNYANEDGNMRSVDSQESEERLRFRRLRCHGLISRFASERSSDFTKEINEQLILHPSNRHHILPLLLRTITACASNIRSLVDLNLFETLINVVLYEKWPLLVHTSTNILCIAIPHLCNKIQKYLPKLFQCLIRLLFFHDKPSITFESSDFKPYHREDNFSDSQLIELCCSRLSLLLFGLYPINFIEFSKDPEEYLRTRAIVITQLDTEALNRKIAGLLEKQNFIFNVDFKKFGNADDELNDTTRLENNKVISFCRNLFSYDYLIQPDEKNIEGFSQFTNTNTQQRRQSPLNLSNDTPSFVTPNFDRRLSTQFSTMDSRSDSIYCPLDSHSPSMQEELLATRKHLFTEQNTGTSIAGSPIPPRSC